MIENEEFDKKLRELLKKHEQLIKNKDAVFLQNFIYHCLSTDTVVPLKTFKIKGSSNNAIYKLLHYGLKFLIIILLVVPTGILLQEKLQLTGSNLNTIMFTIRKWSVAFGLPSFHYILKMAHSTCLIRNPWALPDLSICSCSYSMKQFHIKNLTLSINNFEKLMHNEFMDPFIVENAVNQSLKYSDIKRLVEQNIDMFLHGPNSVIAMDGVSPGSNFKDLFSLTEPPPLSVISWSNYWVNGARGLRSIFPRPQFVPRSKEISLYKEIFFFGKNSSFKPILMDTNLPDNKGKLVYYHQVYGDRQFVLKPLSICRCKKQSFMSFVLTPGQMVAYDANRLQLYSGRIKNTSSDAIGYLGIIM